MKHFGLWNTEVNRWIMDASGMVFWTTSRSVAEAQWEQGLFLGRSRKIEIREFPEHGEAK